MARLVFAMLVLAIFSAAAAALGNTRPGNDDGRAASQAPNSAHRHVHATAHMSVPISPRLRAAFQWFLLATTAVMLAIPVWIVGLGRARRLRRKLAVRVRTVDRQYAILVKSTFHYPPIPA